MVRKSYLYNFWWQSRRRRYFTRYTTQRETKRAQKFVRIEPPNFKNPNFTAFLFIIFTACLRWLSKLWVIFTIKISISYFVTSERICIVLHKYSGVVLQNDISYVWCINVSCLIDNDSVFSYIIEPLQIMDQRSSQNTIRHCSSKMMLLEDFGVLQVCW